MTREQWKEMMPLIQAFIDGETIEVLDYRDGKWEESESIDFTSGVERYRIKPKSKYRQFKDTSECFEEMKKHEPFGWVMSRYHEAYNIWQVGNTAVRIYGGNFSYECALQDYIFADGTPFGIKEEES